MTSSGVSVPRPSRDTRLPLALFLGASAVSACGGNPCDAWLDAGHGAERPADAEEFCVDREFAVCQREQYAGRLDEDAFGECANAISPTCAGASWSPGCAPLECETRACIDLLRRTALVHLTPDELTAMYDDCQVCP